MNSEAATRREELRNRGIDVDNQSLAAASAEAGLPPLGTAPGEAVNGTAVGGGNGDGDGFGGFGGGPQSAINAGGTEPLSPKQLRPEIPSGLEAKGRDLDQVRAEQARLNNAPESAASNARLSALNQRESRLVGAINRQQSVKASGFDGPGLGGSAATRSALQNTVNATSVDPTEFSGTVPNPINRMTTLQRIEATNASEDRINELNRQIGENRNRQFVAAERGATQDIAPFRAAQAEERQLVAARDAEVENLGQLLGD